jgi:hypothetical protein
MRRRFLRGSFKTALPPSFSSASSMTQRLDAEENTKYLSHYEAQTEGEAALEDEAAFSGKQSVVAVPVKLLPKVSQKWR